MSGALPILAALAAAASPAAAPLEALLGPDGSVRLSSGGREIGSIGAGVHLKGWDWRGVSAGTVTAPGSVTAMIDARGGVRVAVVARAAADGDRLRLVYELTPSGSLAVESVHASLNLPASEWTAAPWALGDARGEIPADHREVRLAGGSGALILGPRPGDGLVLTLGAGDGNRLLLQDSRRWGPSLDLRAGILDLSGAVWPAGETRRIEATVSLGGPVQLETDRPVVLEAGAGWIPLDPNPEVVPGTALDWSGQRPDAGPAGALGWPRAVPGRPDLLSFTSSPTAPRRFYGVNLCFSALYPTHDEADRLADRLARRGYNTVRIHHFESMPWSDPPGLVDPRAPDSLTFHPEALDRLQYLIGALKRRGFLLTIDLYVNRAVKAAEVFGPGAEGDVAYRFKHLWLLHDSAMENLKAFARRLLTSVNPYTGLALKDDPVMPWIALVNEANPTNSLDGLRERPEDAKAFDAKFAAWKQATGREGEWGSPACRRFLWELYRDRTAELIRFLKRDLQVRAYVSDLNGWTDEAATQVVRTQLDYVDNHYYWDHPHFLERPWTLPSRGGSGGGSALADGGGLAGRALTRLLDRPFTISEFNFAGPNPYRGEGGLIAGALAALQDWTVLWRFAYAHSRDALFRPEGTGYFDVVADPVMQASEYAAVALFLRGDLQAPDAEVVVAAPEAEWWDDAARWTGGPLSDLAWVAKLGTLVGRPEPSPRRVLLPFSGGYGAESRDQALRELKAKRLLPPDNRTDPSAGRYESATGEVFLDSKSGLLTVATPRTAGLAGPAATAKGIRRAGPLLVAPRGAFSAAWASSLDGKPLRDSRRILFVHLTDVKNTGMRFRGRAMNVLEAWGGAPLLVAAGTASVSLEHADAKRLTVWRLGLDGTRKAKLPSAASGRSLSFTASVEPGNPTLYYEIAAE